MRTARHYGRTNNYNRNVGCMDKKYENRKVRKNKMMASDIKVRINIHDRVATFDEFIAAYILAVLRKIGSVKEACALMDCSPSTVYNRIDSRLVNKALEDHKKAKLGTEGTDSIRGDQPLPVTNSPEQFTDNPMLDANYDRESDFDDDDDEDEDDFDNVI